MISKWKRKPQRICLLMVILMVAGILATRIPTLMHGAHLHPDEFVFFTSAGSVATPPYVYTPHKAYPSGAFVFQMPFHLLGAVLGGPEYNAQLFGRIAGLFYFTLGAVLGFLVVARLTKKSLSACGIYALIMVFSLFHIEQSRYGTGDPVSLFLAMLLLTLLNLWHRRQRPWLLLLASLVAGAMGAVKTPLLAFVLLPLFVRLAPRQTPPRHRFRDCLGVVLCAVAGLLLFTPDFFRDPAFFFKMLADESSSYAAPFYNAVALNNLLSTLLYQLLYADFPLALPFAAYGAWQLYKNRQGAYDAWPLYTLGLPALLVVFLAVNLFVPTFYFRSLYPWFFVCNIYAAIGAAAFARRVFWGRRWPAGAAVALLALFMAGRSLLFCYSMTTPSNTQRIRDMLLTHEKWSERTATVIVGETLYTISPGDLPPSVYSYNSFTEFATQYDNVYLQPGEFAVTDAFENLHARTPLLFNKNSDTLSAHMARNWTDFKETYAPYLIGATHSKFQHYLYGGWLVGSTLSAHEFPINYIYYRPFEPIPAYYDKIWQYETLRLCESDRPYIQTFAGIENALMLVVFPGGMEVVEDGGVLYPLYVPAEDAPEGTMTVAGIGSDGTLRFMEQGTGYIDLTAHMGLESGVHYVPHEDAEGGFHVVTVGARYYTYSGFIYLVYDYDFGRVMDTSHAQGYYSKMYWVLDDGEDPAAA